MATILAVDDDPSIRTVYREMLIVMNHTLVAEACDGEEAVNMYRMMGRHPDIILMDCRMPRKNGIHAMLEIRHMNPDQCIIFVTSDPEAAMEAERLGANTYVLKPFRFEKLSEIINNVLIKKDQGSNTLLRF